jgi:hypothetical protein
MNKQECMGSSIKGVGQFGDLRLSINDMINPMCNLMRECGHISDRRIRIQADSMKLITILNQYQPTLIISWLNKP